MSCARFLLTESNLKLTMKTRRRQILPPSHSPQCYRNYTAINQERKHNKVTRGRCDGVQMPAIQQPPTSRIGPIQQTLSTLQRWRPGGGSIERPPWEQRVSDSAEPPCASPLQMQQQQRSRPRTHGAALLTSALLTR